MRWTRDTTSVGYCENPVRKTLRSWVGRVVTQATRPFLFIALFAKVRAELNSALRFRCDAAQMAKAERKMWC